MSFNLSLPDDQQDIKSYYKNGSLMQDLFWFVIVWSIALKWGLDGFNFDMYGIVTIGFALFIAPMVIIYPSARVNWGFLATPWGIIPRIRAYLNGPNELRAILKSKLHQSEIADWVRARATYSMESNEGWRWASGERMHPAYAEQYRQIINDSLNGALIDLEGREGIERGIALWDALDKLDWHASKWTINAGRSGTHIPQRYGRLLLENAGQYSGEYRELYTLEGETDKESLVKRKLYGGHSIYFRVLHTESQHLPTPCPVLRMGPDPVLVEAQDSTPESIWRALDSAYRCSTLWSWALSEHRSCHIYTTEEMRNDIGEVWDLYSGGVPMVSKLHCLERIDDGLRIYEVELEDSMQLQHTEKKLRTELAANKVSPDWPSAAPMIEYLDGLAGRALSRIDPDAQSELLADEYWFERNDERYPTPALIDALVRLGHDPMWLLFAHVKPHPDLEANTLMEMYEGICRRWRRQDGKGGNDDRVNLIGRNE